LENAPPAPPKSLLELYRGFLFIGACSFGGVLPWAHRVMVEEKRWIAPADFSEVLALCQFLPGPNVGNVSVVLGRRWFGIRGAVVAFAGLMALPYLWILGLAYAYSGFSSVPEIRSIVTGVGVAGAGLFVGTGLKLGRPLANRPAGLAVVLGCFLAVGLARISIFLALPVAAAFAIAAARRKLI
jgi:chromate transporter